MLAAVLVEPGTPLRIMDLEVPELKTGQVLVDVEWAGICGAQLREIDGHAGPDRHLPHLLGHEGAGRVLAVGSGVTTVRVGDSVVLHWRVGAGIEAEPPRYRVMESAGECFVGAGPVAIWSDLAVVSESRVTTVREDVPLDVAALLGCCVTTGLGVVTREAKLRLGESIVIVGCGGVGLSAILGASLTGGYPIIGVDLDARRSALAFEFGATDFSTDLGSVFHSPDVFVDCTGVPEVIRTGLRSLKRGGRLVLVGQPKHGTDFIMPEFVSRYSGKTVLDSQGGMTRPELDIPRYLELYRGGRLPIDKLITRRFSLLDVGRAVSASRFGGAGRVLMDCRVPGGEAGNWFSDAG